MAARQRITLLGLAALVAVVAVVLIGTGGGGNEPAPAPVATTETASRTTTPVAPRKPAKTAVLTIVVRDGRPVGGVRRLTFRKGATIAFAVRSDTAAEVHVHGYDIAKDVAAGGTVRFAIPATIDGRFEVELEQTAEPIAELEVQP